MGSPPLGDLASRQLRGPPFCAIDAELGPRRASVGRNISWMTKIGFVVSSIA